MKDPVSILKAASLACCVFLATSFGLCGPTEKKMEEFLGFLKKNAYLVEQKEGLAVYSLLLSEITIKRNSMFVLSEGKGDGKLLYIKKDGQEVVSYTDLDLDGVFDLRGKEKLGKLDIGRNYFEELIDLVLKNKKAILALNATPENNPDMAKKKPRSKKLSRSEMKRLVAFIKEQAYSIEKDPGEIKYTLLLTEPSKDDKSFFMYFESDAGKKLVYVTQKGKKTTSYTDLDLDGAFDLENTEKITSRKAAEGFVAGMYEFTFKHKTSIVDLNEVFRELNKKADP